MEMVGLIEGMFKVKNEFDMNHFSNYILSTSVLEFQNQKLFSRMASNSTIQNLILSPAKVLDEKAYLDTLESWPVQDAVRPEKKKEKTAGTSFGFALLIVCYLLYYSTVFVVCGDNYPASAATKSVCTNYLLPSSKLVNRSWHKISKSFVRFVSAFTKMAKSYASSKVFNSYHEKSTDDIDAKPLEEKELL